MMTPLPPHYQTRPPAAVPNGREAAHLLRALPRMIDRLRPSNDHELFKGTKFTRLRSPRPGRGWCDMLYDALGSTVILPPSTSSAAAFGRLDARATKPLALALYRFCKSDQDTKAVGDARASRNTPPCSPRAASRPLPQRPERARIWGWDGAFLFTPPDTERQTKPQTATAVQPAQPPSQPAVVVSVNLRTFDPLGCPGTGWFPFPVGLSGAPFRLRRRIGPQTLRPRPTAEALLKRRPARLVARHLEQRP